MAAHRKPRTPRTRSLTGHTARTALTLALAGAASATALDGTGHADPPPTPAQVKAKVDKLYRAAEAATEKYNGSKEKADAAKAAVRRLQDEAARRTETLNSARTSLGSAATAQYRTGGIDPSLQLALSSEPDQYLDQVMRADRAGDRQAATITGVRHRLRELDRLREQAGAKQRELSGLQADLKKRKSQITSKLDRARKLLDKLTDEQRARMAGDSGPDRASRDLPRGDLKAPNSRAARAISFSHGALGSPYVWGATGPDSFDCSGLTQAAYRAAGVSLPRTTYAQINAGKRVSRSELAPGDLVFFYSSISHVGIYIGNGRMIHAPNPNAPVRIAPIDEMPFAGAARVV
ncbi:putative endopeptidase precursor [Streptomyces sp. YIM 130001]|uniref:C40 family peptidase n=1 Tax=Streptomyces sp. YIM 130001 TaxID=2259644 RepID=UPI000E65CDD4|nr:C40 family peptidase [Streptomyces sp. YIM 130001]RII21043.1 putative endopeptidase precursor [Streptomyces sp. YIM 130001]